MVTTKSYWGYYWSPKITQIWANIYIKKLSFLIEGQKKAEALRRS